MVLLLCMGKIMELLASTRIAWETNVHRSSGFVRKYYVIQSVMPVVASIVHCFRSIQLKPRLFEAFLEKIGAEYSDFLYHTELRWLSRFVTLKMKISQFLQSELRKFGALENEAYNNDQLLFILIFSFREK